jgi:HrpA-like RNA helicase
MGVGDGQARAAQEAARIERNADAESVRLTEDMANKKQNPEYLKFEQSRSKLPAWAARCDISRALATHQVRQQHGLHSLCGAHSTIR